MGTLCSCGDLDDPDNPYRGLYSPLDRWAYDNWVPADDPRLHQGYDPQDPNMALGAIADSGGWVVPRRLGYNGDEPRTPHEFVQHQSTEFRATENARTYGFAAYGPRPADNIEAMDTQTFLYEQARSTSPIPSWLADAVPVATIFVPNGDILCYAPDDPLARAKIRGMFDFTQFPGHWQRYAPDGRLLDEPAATTSPDWQELYFPGYREKVSSGVRVIDGMMHQDEMIGLYNGFIVVFTKPSGFNPSDPREDDYSDLGALAAYDFDGTAVPLDAPFPDRHGMQYGDPLSARRLSELYRVQRELGLTE
jgi:hypothetical protein